MEEGEERERRRTHRGGQMSQGWWKWGVGGKEEGVYEETHPFLDPSPCCEAAAGNVVVAEEQWVEIDRF
eukprot:159718-Hanusia_phi.AAC.1